MEKQVLISAFLASIFSALLLLETLTIGQNSPKTKFQRFLYAEVFFLSSVLSFGAMVLANNPIPLILWGCLALGWFLLGTVWMWGAIKFE